MQAVNSSDYSIAQASQGIVLLLFVVSDLPFSFGS
jgi:hypothetical protein